MAAHAGFGGHRLGAEYEEWPRQRRAARHRWRRLWPRGETASVTTPADDARCPARSNLATARHELTIVPHGAQNWNPAKGGNWSVIKAPVGLALTRFISVADVLPSSVIGVCLGGVAFITTITGPTTATWKNTSLNCIEVAINPNNKDHFIYSNMSSLGKQILAPKPSRF